MPSTTIVINEFAVAGATAADEYIELKNISGGPIDLNGYRLVYRSASGTTDVAIINWTTSTIIPAGGYLLVAHATGYTGTKTPDFTWAGTSTGTFSGTAGGIALRQGAANTGTIIDSVAYGTATNAFREGTAAPAPSASQALLRSQDTDNNVSDFALGARDPQNLADTPSSVPNLAINNVSQDEDTGAYTFTVTLSAPAGPGGVTFDIATADGTAQDDNPTSEDSDYVAKSLTGQTIAEGQTSATFTVAVNPDNIREGNETFFVNITNVTGANVTDGQGQGTIVDDDTPVLTIADVSQTEGNSGTVTYSFTVSLNKAAPFGGVTFDIATADNSATTADNDYVSRTLASQTIPEGQTTYTFDVTVNSDTVVEPNESFVVNITNVTGASVGDGQATGTITNDDVPPTPVASVNDVAVTEGDAGVSYASFTVSLSFAPTGPVTVDYSTSNGTAAAGSDYVATSGTVSFAAGETVKTVSVPVIGDTRAETSENFTVTLSNPSGATLGDASGAATITDNDGTRYFALSSGSFSQDWTNTNLITANDDWSGVPHIIGYLGDNVTSDVGANPGTLTGSTSTIDVIAQAATTSTSGGVGEFQLANPTIGLQGSGTADAPYIVLHLDSTGRQQVTVSYRLRDIDGTADNAAQPVALQYRIGTTGDWINVPAAYVADATTGPSTLGPDILVSAALPAEAANQPQLQVRMITANANGNDEWVGIDDIVVTSQPAAVPALSIADTAAYEGTGGSNAIVFTVTRQGDTTGSSSADWTVSFAGAAYLASANDLAPAQPLAGTVAFAPGETTKTITLDVATDANPEGDEGFTLTLSNPSNATLADAVAIGTVVNDDGPPPFVAIGDVTQLEGNAGTTVFAFTVTRTGGTGAFTVDYATAGGTATAGTDFVATSGTLSFAAGENSKTIEVAVNGDTAGELAETFTVQLSNPTGFAVVADASGTGTIQNDDMLFIHQIQGNSYYSPILAAEGKSAFNLASTMTVTIQAVVTAVDNDGTRQGFYVSEELGHWDSDFGTSEGIFVMTRNDAGAGTDVVTAAPGVQVGDLVTITAKVMEYQAFASMPRTTLVDMSGFSIASSGNPLPKMTLDASRPIPNSIFTLVTPDYTDFADDAGDTFDADRYGLSFWETVEGMLVTIPDMVVADGFVSTSGGQPIFQAYSRVHADADQINSRGGYTTAGDPPLSPPDTADPDDDTIAGGRHVHDGDTNPDIIEIDFSGFAIDAPAGLTGQLSMGDGLGDVTGIVDFDFTDRKLFVTEFDPGAFVDTVPTLETTTLGNDPRSLTVATFNVENLDPGDGAARFAAIAQAIAVNLNSPDIVIIEEMQDNNGAGTGVTDASTSWQMLVDALNAAVPGANYQWVDQEPVNGAEGGEPGGNIRVGFLYDTNRVQLGDLPANASIEERRKYTDRIGDGVRDAGDLIAFSDDMIAGQINTADWSGTRKSLLAQFTFNGQTVFVTANHLPAKSGSGSFWQLNQNLAAGQPANSDWSQRNAIAEDIYLMLNHIASSAPNAGIVSGGDFNDFYFTRPLEVATGYVLPDGTARSGGIRLENLMVADLPEAERYSYTFDGRSQALDFILANALLGGVSSYDVVHLNTGFNPLGTGANADQSISDHDPAVASFDFRSLSEVLTGTAGADFFDMSQGGNDSVAGGAGNDGFFFGAQLTSADSVDGGADRDYLTLQGDYSGGVALGSGVVNLELLTLLSGTDTRYGLSGGASFDYSLTSHDANVAAGQLLIVDGGQLKAGEDLTFDGSAEMDGSFRFWGGEGKDTLTGGLQSDYFFFSAGRFGADDRLNGGGGTAMNQLSLLGDYTIAFGENQLTAIQSFVFLSGRGLASPTDHTYDITMHDSIVAAGVRAIIDGGQLTATETLTFNGSAETDGSFRIFGGKGSDSLTGGQGEDILLGAGGADYLKGGAGVDVFKYREAADSTSTSYDQIDGFVFGEDTIDVPGTHDAYEVKSGGVLSTASFDADLAAAMAGTLDSMEAVLFTADSGDLAGRLFLIVDQNGTAGYQAGEDFVIELLNTSLPVGPIPDFIV